MAKPPDAFFQLIVANAPKSYQQLDRIIFNSDSLCISKRYEKGNGNTVESQSDYRLSKEYPSVSLSLQTNDGITASDMSLPSLSDVHRPIMSGLHSHRDLCS
jgi:hypothetical protein